MNKLKKRAMKSFVALCNNLVGSNRRDDYSTVVNKFLRAYGEKGCKHNKI